MNWIPTFPNCVLTSLLFIGAATSAVGTEPGSGSLVSTFGNGGIATVVSSSEARSVLVQADGKILVGHSSGGNFILRRHLPTGAPDTAFGTAGVVTADAGSTEELYDLAFQADGKVIAAGASQVGPLRTDFLAVRYLTNGTLDTSFSGDGMANVSYSDWQGYQKVIAQSVLVQSDGKIILGGHFQQSGTLGSTWRLMRLLANGTLDTSFGTSGHLSFGYAHYSALSDMVSATDGGSILVGHFRTSNPKAAVARLTPGGERDTAFSAPLELTLGSRTSDYKAVTVDPSGRIVGAGYISGPSRMLVTRYLSSGVLDTTFGNGQGHAMLEPEGTIQDIQALPDGKYMICGSVTEGALVGRLLENGRFDPSFGPEANGFVIIPQLSDAQKMARLSVGQWVVVGRPTGPNGGISLAAVHEGPATPAWVTVTHLPATPVAQDTTLTFSPAAPQTSGGSHHLKVSNAGDLSLTGLTVITEGADYTVSPLSATQLIPGDSTTFTVTFAPSGSAPGLRTSKLKIQSADPDSPVYELNLQGNVLSFTEDSDGDGLNDASEYQMRALGFDFQTPQAGLVQTLFSHLKGTLPNLNQAGFYSEQQIQDLRIETPMLVRDPQSGRFTLRLGLEASQDLQTFSPLSFTAPETSVTPEGKVEFEFDNSEGVSFYRLVTE